MTHLVIDGDLLAFKSTAVNEQRSIRAIHKATKEVKELALRTELKNLVDDYEEWEIEDVQTPKNFQFSRNSANDLIDKWVSFSGANTFEIVLTGKNNFRDYIPLPSRYKSNREDNLRPLHLKKMKEWLVEEYDAIITKGCEADDYLAMEAYKGYKEGKKFIQCSIDKDAWGCDGWVMHMDCISPPELISGFGELHLITKDKKKELKGRGKIWMLAQSVLGDKSDGYKPSEIAGKKWGDTSCYNLLKDCKSYKEAVEAIYQQYKEWYPEPITYTAWDGKEYTKNAIEIWQMYFDCARMRRWENDEILLTDVLDKLGIAYA